MIFSETLTTLEDGLIMSEMCENRGSPTLFWSEHACKNALSLKKNRASLTNKAAVCKPKNIAIRSLI